MSEITAESVRAEARAWLEENWNPDQGLVEWRNTVSYTHLTLPTKRIV